VAKTLIINSVTYWHLCLIIRVLVLSALYRSVQSLIELLLLLIKTKQNKIHNK